MAVLSSFFQMFIVLGMYNFADQLKIPLNKLPSVGVMMGLSSHRAVVGAVVVEVEVLGRSTVPEGVVTTTTLGGVMATCGGSEVVTLPVLPTEVGTPK